MNHGRYAHILSFALTHPWNVEPQMLSVIAGILARHIAGVDSTAEIQAALVNRKNLPQPRAGSVAIIPIYGVIAPRMNMFSEISGGTTFQKLSSQLRTVVADKSVRNIVLDIDSPGGSVAGNAEFATEVLKARTKKPIIAVGQYTMASAAYQVAAAATEIVAAPSTLTGSIGTYTMHDDLSEALKQLGVKRTYISAGEGKVEGNSSEPLSQEAQARLQSAIDAAFGVFVSNVVKGRGQGMTAERVRKDWKAYVYPSEEALALGMIDRIATLDDTVARLLADSPDVEDQRAALTFASTDDSSSTDDTSQEPVKATDQDRRPEHALERQVLELQLAATSLQ